MAETYNKKLKIKNTDEQGEKNQQNGKHEPLSGSLTSW
jgi:hypothetical protein